MLLNVHYMVYCVVFYVVSFLPCVCIFLVVYVGELFSSYCKWSKHINLKGDDRGSRFHRNIQVLGFMLQ